MLKTPVGFATTLTAKMVKGSQTLPISQDAETKLRAFLDEGDYTYLTIREPTGAEVVKVENDCDTLLVTRAQDGTEERTFPMGSCVLYETSPAVVKELICTHDCCEGECPCVDAEPAGFTLPNAKVGVPWTGFAVFSGDLPMALAATGAPSWVTVEVGPNFIKFTGNPNGAGSFTIAASASNCSGHVSVQQGVLNVQA